MFAELNLRKRQDAVAQPYPVHAAAPCISSDKTQSLTKEAKDNLYRTYASAEKVQKVKVTLMETQMSFPTMKSGAHILSEYIHVNTPS